VVEDGKVLYPGMETVPAVQAYTNHTWKYWEALRLISDSFEESFEMLHMDITDSGKLIRRRALDYV
jgi:hypothetical protein